MEVVQIGLSLMLTAVLKCRVACNSASWEPHIEKLQAKLASSIAVIKRIMKFIPKTEYKKLCDSLFKSHLSYCISCWGGITPYRLSKLFSLQKRCVRLLFGTKPTFDNNGYYETCARARTFSEHIAKKSRIRQP